MSRHNKVNPDHYKTAGRLTADELARELQKQRGREAAPRVHRATAPRRRKPAAASQPESTSTPKGGSRRVDKA